MINLNLQVSQSVFYEESFCVSRSSRTYEYLRSEFNDLARDPEGNYLLSGIMPKETSLINKVLNSIKERLADNEKAIGVALGSPEYTFFQSEYSNRFSEDTRHNIIVPSDDYPKVKTK